MNTRTEIHALIDQLPEAILPDLRTYLQQLAATDIADAELVLRIRQILEEDKNLLHRLAQ